MKDNKRLIPQNCPECNYKFTFKDKSNHQMQKKAKMMYASIALVLPIWFTIIFLFLNSLKVVESVIFYGVIVVAGLTPGLILASKAYSMPRILLLKCKKCTFKQDIILRKPKEIDPFDFLEKKP